MGDNWLMWCSFAVESLACLWFSVFFSLMLKLFSTLSAGTKPRYVSALVVRVFSIKHRLGSGVLLAECCKM